MRDRSWRRYQRTLAIDRARRHMRDNGFFYHSHSCWTEYDAELAIRKNAITPQPCSLYCCGNPRKWFGQETHQEQIARLNEQDYKGCSENDDPDSEDTNSH